MPNVSITLPEVSQSISRPIIFDVVNQVSEITNINKKTNIYFPGDLQKMQTSGSSINSNRHGHPVFNTKYITHVIVEENYDEESLGTTDVNKGEHLPIFIDRKLNVFITPIYVKSNVSINFRYSSPSKNEVLKWRDDIRFRLSQLRNLNIHNLRYHYSIPNPFIKLLSDIHINRERLEGYGDDIGKYIVNNSTDKLTIIGDLSGKHSKVSIAETQTRVSGDYGFDPLPEQPKNEEGVWEIEFNYSFSYDKPIACNMKYPVIVHNKLLPKDYITYEDSFSNLHEVKKTSSLSIHNLENFENKNLLKQNIPGGKHIVIPDFDDHFYRRPITGSEIILGCLCEVDETNKKDLLNLKQLGQVVLDKDIIDFIDKTEHSFICKPYKSIITVSVMVNNTLLKYEGVTCDSDLNISTVNELSLRDQHRVVLSVTTELSLLPDVVIERLRNHPKAFCRITESMDRRFINHPDLIWMNKQKKITKLEFNIVYRILTGRNFYKLDIRSSGKYDIFKDIDSNNIVPFKYPKYAFNPLLTTKLL